MVMSQLADKWNIFSSFLWLFINWESSKNSQRDELNKNTPEQFTWSYADTKQILIPIQRMTFDHFTSVFNHSNLDSKSNNGNYNENWIFMKRFEYVELTFNKKTSIELVENLHEYECLEYVSE